MTTQTPEKTSRRDFLRIAWSALAGLAALELGGLTLAYMQPRLTEGEFGSVITVGEVDTFPPGSVTPVTAGRFYLSRLADGGFLAIYQRCTHLGCTVPWEQTEEKFICPCHNSQFTPDGEVLNPPALRSLDLFTVIIEDGMVKVDTSKPITRPRFDPSQVVYA
ncbi:MAG: Rieske 2Fe-2S domain-containing protein [Chloroflexi bacterium]|nr:Rieske 2Fe-2S domain-containing protein [Chloroflexota bacterium]